MGRFPEVFCLILLLFGLVEWEAKNLLGLGALFSRESFGVLGWFMVFFARGGQLHGSQLDGGPFEPALSLTLYVLRRIASKSPGKTALSGSPPQ